MLIQNFLFHHVLGKVKMYLGKCFIENGREVNVLQTSLVYIVKLLLTWLIMG